MSWWEVGLQKAPAAVESFCGIETVMDVPACPLSVNLNVYHRVRKISCMAKKAFEYKGFPFFAQLPCYLPSAFVT